MKSFPPTRVSRITLALAISLVCAGTACAQRRGGGGGGMRVQSFHQSAPQSFRQPAPQGFRQQAPPQTHQAPVERRGAQGQPSQAAPIERRNPQGQGQGQRGEHLDQWMSQHRNLTPQQQQQALDREPGFRALPQATQDRYRNRLAQLNAMPADRRERILNYNERMEHLSVDQRSEVRGSLQQLGALPPDQRRQVAQSFRQLRELPPEQRGAALNSPQFQYMNPAQRSTLNNLLHVEPLLPPSEQQPR